MRSDACVADGGGCVEFEECLGVGGDGEFCGVIIEMSIDVKMWK